MDDGFYSKYRELLFIYLFKFIYLYVYLIDKNIKTYHTIKHVKSLFYFVYCEEIISSKREYKNKSF